MAVKVKKITRGNKKGSFEVSTPGGVKAKGTTREKAEAQKRLLEGVKHGRRPRGKKRRGGE